MQKKLEQAKQANRKKRMYGLHSTIYIDLWIRGLYVDLTVITTNSSSSSSSRTIAACCRSFFIVKRKYVLKFLWRQHFLFCEHVSFKYTRTIYCKTMYTTQYTTCMMCQWFYYSLLILLWLDGFTAISSVVCRIQWCVSSIKMRPLLLIELCSEIKINELHIVNCTDPYHGNSSVRGKMEWFCFYFCTFAFNKKKFPNLIKWFLNAYRMSACNCVYWL